MKGTCKQFIVYAFGCAFVVVGIVCECCFLFKSVQQQLAFKLGRQQICFDLDSSMPNRDDLTEIMENILLNNHFLSLTREVSSSNGCLCVCMFVRKWSVFGGKQMGCVSLRTAWYWGLGV